MVNIASSPMESSPSPTTLTGTIVFSTVGRADYGFDIFSLPLHNISSSTELRLTDSISINFNGHFLDDNLTLLFISERTGSPRVYLTRPNTSNHPQQLPSAPGSLFHDRPILHRNRLFFISAHQPSLSLYNSWSALYSTFIHTQTQNDSKITRLTPLNEADFSPAISPSGKFIAVASYGSKNWEGEFHELHTHILVFPLSEPLKRTVLAHRGGWPTWSTDKTLYFHRLSDDGWWSIYRVGFDESPRRVTPPGLHVFTPAAIQNTNKIAVATRRKGRLYRHIEIFNTESGEFQPVTELINPEFHHYNPFVSPGSKFIGYHRFRGMSNQQQETDSRRIIPNLEPILSPIKSLKMMRINGSFPSFSPNGDFIAFNHDFDRSNNGGLKIMKSDGSKRWSLIKNQVAFYNSWAPDKNKHVIFTSLGSIFQPAQVTVQVARVTFDASNLNQHTKDVENVEVKIMTKPETGNNGFPACSPDGKSVVFRSGRSGYKNLYIMDAFDVDGDGDGEESNIRQLTEGPWTDTMPSWSPNGELIAFSSNRHDVDNPVTFGIYLMKPDGSDVRRVEIEGSSDDVAMERINHVCFSPNGEWLLFTSNMGGVTAEPVSLPNQFQPYGDLFIVKVDGSGLRRLTWNGYENGTPTWHPIGGIDVDFGNLSLNGGGGVHCDELKGQFVDPLWITCDF